MILLISLTSFSFPLLYAPNMKMLNPIRENKIPVNRYEKSKMDETRAFNIPLRIECRSFPRFGKRRL